MISTRQKKMIDERDGLESHNIREVTDELNEVALRAKWATLKNAKPTPRGAKAEPRLDGPPKMLTQNGLDTLADLVPFHDIESMKPQIELPGGHDRDRRANLLESLHKLNEQHPHIQNSFQFLAHTDTCPTTTDRTTSRQYALEPASPVSSPAAQQQLASKATDQLPPAARHARKSFKRPTTAWWCHPAPWAPALVLVGGAACRTRDWRRPCSV